MDRAARAHVAALALSLASSACTYLSQLVLARSLAPADFSAYNAITALGVTLFALLSVVNLASSKRVAELSERGTAAELGGFVRRTGAALMLAAAAVVAIPAAASPWLRDWLKIEGTTPILLYLLNLFFAVAALYGRSVVQGLGAYVTFTALYLVHTSAFLALAALSVAGLGGGVNAAMGANLAATLLTGAVTLAALRRRAAPVFAAREPFALGFPPLRDVAWVGSVGLMLAAFTNLDVAFARALFPPDDAGLYAGTAVIGRIAFYAAGILPSILFPEVVRRQARGEGSMRPFISTLLLTALVSGAFTGLVLLAPQRILTLLLGPAYAAGAGILGLQTVSMGLWALNSLFLHLFAAKGFRAGIVGGGIAGAAALAISPQLGRESPHALALAWTAGAALVLAFNVAYCAWRIDSRKTLAWLPPLGIAAALLAFAFTRLAFTPVPWPDASAFFLPGLDLWSWPPRWRMHAQAAFIPSYDHANFNTMPLLPFLLGLDGRVGLSRWLGPALGLKLVSLAALGAYVWLLGSLAREILGARVATGAAAALAAAALFDPVLRWGTLVVRSETWVGLCWLFVLREIIRGVDRPGAAWRMAAGLAVGAGIHFEAIVMVPATALALVSGGARASALRLWGVGWRVTALLSPWLVYVASHPGLFLEQMDLQFHRLAKGNPYVTSSLHSLFHSLFISHGSPVSWPKFFNAGKGVYWVMILWGLWAALLRAPSRQGSGPARAAALAFLACFYLWGTKPEVWFTTLCHLTLFPLLATLLPRAPRAVGGLAAAYAFFGISATLVQGAAIPGAYSWERFDAWVGCIERTVDTQAAKAGIERPTLWQPHVPDALSDLALRRPDWDLTRAFDFERTQGQQAEAFAREVDVLLLSHAHLDLAPGDHEGPARPEDLEAMKNGIEVPWGPWTLRRLADGSPGAFLHVCRQGPFWGALLFRTGR